MGKNKKRPTATLYEHDHGDSTENSVIQISGDFRRRRVRSRPARLQQPAVNSSSAWNGDQDGSLFDPYKFQDSLPEAITDQVEGITVVAKARAKRYENSVSTSCLVVPRLSHAVQGRSFENIHALPRQISRRAALQRGPRPVHGRPTLPTLRVWCGGDSM